MNEKVLFLIIILLAFGLRFIGLESLSPPLNRDEAAIGYNAYSLLITGKDEHGQSWPLAFKSIGDYKMPGYVYLTMIPVKIFGLNVVSVRLGSALAGLLAVVGIYFLGKELAKFIKTDKISPVNTPIIMMFLLAVNPWHIHYSRIGFEANLNLTFFIWAVVFFFNGIKKSWWLIGTSWLMVLMQFTYSSSFIFLPGILILMAVILYKSAPAKLACPKTLLPIFLSLVILISGSMIAFKSVYLVSSAKQAITIFGDPQVLDNFNQLRGKWNQENIIVARLWFNKPFYLIRLFFINYLKHFSPEFLFFNQVTHPWHAIKGQGVFYFIDGVWFLLGITWFLKKILKKFNFIAIFLASWLLLSPLASSITIDSPHATRSLYLIPVFLIFVSYGLSIFINWFNSKVFSLELTVIQLLISLYLILLTNLIYQYLYVYPKFYDRSFYIGVKSVIHDVIFLNDQLPVYFTNASASPYLYLLFYAKINPAMVQETGIWSEPNLVGLSNLERIGKYHFIEGMPKISQPHYLILNNQTAPAGYRLITEYKDDRNQSIWQIYKAS